MSRIDNGVVGEDEQTATDMVDKFVEVATGQVGPSDTALEEHIAREHAMLGSAIIDKASG